MNRNRCVYAYSVLKYVHDVVSGESLNVGAVVLCPSSGELVFRHAQSLDRIAAAFPTASLAGLRSTLKCIGENVERLNSLSRPKTEVLPDLLKRVLPTDNSSLQWAPPGSGVTSSVPGVVDEIYERFVSRCFRYFDEVESAVIETKRYHESASRSILHQASNDDQRWSGVQLEAGLGARR